MKKRGYAAVAVVWITCRRLHVMSFGLCMLAPPLAQRLIRLSWFIDGGTARFGKTYAGEPEQLVKELADDEAIAAADTLLLTVPNQLGVDYNAHVLETVLTQVAPDLGWR